MTKYEREKIKILKESAKIIYKPIKNGINVLEILKENNDNINILNFLTLLKHNSMVLQNLNIDVINNEEDLREYWNDYINIVSHSLLLPTNKDLINISKFNYNLLERIPNSSLSIVKQSTIPTNNIRSLIFEPIINNDSKIITRCYKFRVFLNKNQKCLANKIYGVSRLVYNQAIYHIKKNSSLVKEVMNCEKCKEKIKKLKEETIDNNYCLAHKEKKKRPKNVERSCEKCKEIYTRRKKQEFCENHQHSVRVTKESKNCEECIRIKNELKIIEENNSKCDDHKNVNFINFIVIRECIKRILKQRLKDHKYKSLDWFDQVPDHTKFEPITQAIGAYHSCLTKLREQQIDHFELGYRNKKNKRQVMDVRKDTITIEDENKKKELKIQQYL